MYYHHVKESKPLQRSQYLSNMANKIGYATWWPSHPPPKRLKIEPSCITKEYKQAEKGEHNEFGENIGGFNLQADVTCRIMFSFAQFTFETKSKLLMFKF